MKKLYVLIFLAGCLIQAGAGLAQEIDLPYSSLLKPEPPILASASAGEGDGQQSFLDMSQGMESGRKISMAKAMLLSFVFPGAGQYYADAKFKGQVFMGMEASIWAGFIAYRVYGGWKEDDYKDYAAAHAGVDNTGKDDEFYDWLGFYDNRNEFNQLGRLYYPERAYLPDNESYYWQWDSEASRLTYKDIKDDSKRAFRNSTFLLGLAVANRIIASIDTYRTVKRAQARIRSLTQVGEYHFTVSPKLLGDNPQVKLSVTRKF